MRCTSCAGTGVSCTPLSQQTLLGAPIVDFAPIETPCSHCSGTGIEPKKVENGASAPNDGGIPK